MTYQNAINILETLKNGELSEGQREALEQGIVALGKQMPKRLSVTSMNFGNATCTHCNHTIPFDEYEPTENWWRENRYCRHCGQAIYSVFTEENENE